MPDPHIMRVATVTAASAPDPAAAEWATVRWLHPAGHVTLQHGERDEGSSFAGVAAETHEDRWIIEGPQAQLTLAADGEEYMFGTEEVQLTVELTSAELSRDGRTVLMSGLRAELAGADPSRWGLTRVILAPFATGAGYAVATLRPPKAKGQDKDLILAALISPEGRELVEDPRVSVTRDRDGGILRAGLELWLEPEEPDGDQFPHRVAGARVGEETSPQGRCTRLSFVGRGRTAAGAIWETV